MTLEEELLHLAKRCEDIRHDVLLVDDEYPNALDMENGVASYNFINALSYLEIATNTFRLIASMVKEQK